MTKVLVTGATGNVGSWVVKELRGHGASIRAFVRDPDRAAEKLGDDVELAVGDFSDTSSLHRALEVADHLFLTSADSPQMVEHETAVIEAAAAAGVSRIVKLSTLGAKVGSPLPPFDWHGRIEQHLWRSEVPAVVLRANFYMSNLLGSAESIRQTGKLFAPADGAKIAMIDPRDVAAVAAVVLTTDIAMRARPTSSPVLKRSRTSTLPKSFQRQRAGPSSSSTCLTRQRERALSRPACRTGSWSTSLECLGSSGRVRSSRPLTPCAL